MSQGGELNTSSVPIFFVLYGTGHRRGGLTRNALHRAMLLADRLERPTTVLTFEFNQDLEYSKERLTSAGLLGDGVLVRNIFQDMGLYGGDPTAFFARRDIDTEVLSSQCLAGNCAEIGELDALNSASLRDEDDRLNLTLHDDNGADVARVCHDMLGRPRVLECIDSASGRVVHRRFLDEAGRCRAEFTASDPSVTAWSIKVLDESGNTTRTFPSQLRMRREWLDSHATAHDESIFQVESETPLVIESVLRMRAPGVARVHLMHSGHLDEPYTLGSPNRVNHAEILDALKHFDAFVLITEEHRRDIELEYGRRETLHVVPHDVSLPATTQDIDRDPLLAVGVGRFTAEKNWDHVIRAFPSIIERVPDARFELWGMGDLAEEYRELISELDLEKNVRVMGMTTDASAVFRHASFSVLPSSREGFPLVLLESMAEGAPPVAYDCKYGVTEIVHCGTNGLIVPINDTAALADAMLSLFESPARARALGKEAHRIRERFPARACVDGWLAVYKAARAQRDNSTMLPKITARTHRVRVNRRSNRVDVRIHFDEPVHAPDISLYMRPRGTLAGARFTPTKCKIDTVGDFLATSTFKSSTFGENPCKWDLFMSVASGSSHRFVRIGTSAEHFRIGSEVRWAPFETQKSNLSWKPARPKPSLMRRLRRFIGRRVRRLRSSIGTPPEV